MCPVQQVLGVTMESPVDLPTVDCCKKDCLQCLRTSPFLAQPQSRLLGNVERLDQAGRNALWFNLLLQMNRTHPSGPARATYYWHGVLCQQGFAAVTGCAAKKLRAYVKAIAAGAV